MGPADENRASRETSKAAKEKNDGSKLPIRKGFMFTCSDVRLNRTRFTTGTSHPSMAAAKRILRTWYRFPPA